MKVAFTAAGADLDGPLDPRFGRAPRFIVYDIESGSREILDNTQNLNAAQGAGIQAAATIARSGAECLVTGHCGPKAFQVLGAAGVRIYLTDAPTVAEALRRFQAGEIAGASMADVDSHWS
jgi:predicted Fe-Mo cluster-binding NifX family protein